MTVCEKCNGTGGITVPVEEHLGTVLYGTEQCDECNGTGEVQTNFDRITASPEALAEFIEIILDTCRDDLCECDMCPLVKHCNSDDSFKKIAMNWLNDESKE